LNSVGKGGQPWHTTLLISANFDSLELNFINTLFCVYTSTIAFNIVSGIFLGFKISNKICFCLQSDVYFMIYKQQVCYQITFPSFFN